MPECVGCILNGGTHKYISQLDLSSAYCSTNVDKIYARYDTIIEDYKYGTEGNNLLNTSLIGETGFVVTGHYNAVVNTDIEYSATAGIMVDGSYNYIENNFIDKTGYGVTYHSGINIGAKHIDGGFPAGGHQIYQNSVIGAGRACIGAGGGPIAPWDIAYNDLGWANAGATDSGVFYFYGTIGGTELTPTTIHHNAIHDNIASDIGSTMTTVFYSDGHTMLCDVYNNIFYHSSNDLDYIMEDISTRYQAYEFWQDDKNSQAFQRHWGNMTKTFEYPDRIEFNISDYPNGYPLHIGAFREDQPRFMMNYNRDRDNSVVTLGNSVLNLEANVRDDNTVVFPQANSTAFVDGVELGENGTRIDLYYSGDYYTKDPKSFPTVSLELLDASGSTVGTITKPLKKFSEYADVLSHISIYVSAKYKDCTSIRLSTSSRDVGFAKMIFEDIDLAAENAKVTVPYDADIIMFGSADVLNSSVGNSAMAVTTSKKAFSIDKDRYNGINNTYSGSVRFDNRVISKSSTKLTIDASTSYAFCNTKATVYIYKSNYNTEKIAEVDYSTAWEQGDQWTPRQITVNLTRTLEPGTYSFLVKWSSTDGNSTSTTRFMAFH